MVIGSTRAAICTTKILLSAFSTAAANSLLLIISTLLVFGKVFAVV